MNSPRYLFTTTLLVVALGSGGIAQEPVAATAERSPHSIADSRISTAVHDALRRDDGVSAHLIDVETDNGIVTLTGTVSNLLAKDRSLEVTESIKGVRAVVNRIEVIPPRGLTDADLAQRVRDALLLDPATDSYELEVSAEDGKIILEGTAESWVERDLSADVARSVAGVRAVENRIEVRYVDRPDSEIASDIRGLLDNDIMLEPGAIVVEVDDGVVKLSGFVGSAREKRRAEFHAWIGGVRSVDDSELKVRWWAHDEIPRRDPDAKPSDDSIEKAIVAAFLFDPRVYSFEPEVSVDAGVATLTGTVDNLRARRAAVQDARNTVGVWRVRDYLRVRTTPPPSEAEIETRVEAALQRNPYLEHREIDPVIMNQKVYLYGTVDSEFERRQAERVVASVNGVVAIDNHIEVSPAPVALGERELRQEIEDALWWSPFVDPTHVRVVVDRDTAILSGEVDSWLEWTEAMECASSCGATRVINRLEVGDATIGSER